MKLYTIGFTKKSAERFFGLLANSGAKRVVDVRLRNASQLAGFAKKDDLAYFLRVICDMGYEHLHQLAPTAEMLDGYRKHHKEWPRYETEFLELMRRRGIENEIPKDLIEDSCLLCSEHTPDHCHRRLVAEYLAKQWGDVEIVHLR